MNNELDIFWEIYLKSVYEYADRIFRTEIKPFLNRNKYSFIAGNGTWFIKNKNEDIVDPSDLPEHILYILETTINGLPGNDLGSLMPKYHPRKNNHD